MSTILVIVAILLLGLVLLGMSPKTIVYEYERGVLYRRGRMKGVIGAGEYRYWFGATTVHRVDVRPARSVVAGQEVVSADGIPVKASVIATTRVVDVERAVMGSDNYQLAMHTELQLALRSVVTRLPIEELLQKRGDISAEIKKSAAEPLLGIGIELIDASLRDLTFPGEVKKIFTQVVKARQEGLAALEKARGETAALRNLANAASLIDRNPTLMQLRALQTLGQQPGSTLVLGIQAGTTVVPVRGEGQSGTPPPIVSPTDRE
jgi:regulator of protease activity HflC (stomatin/prohibitin superfamily)